MKPSIKLLLMIFCYSRCEELENTCDEFFDKNEFNIKFQFCDPLTSSSFSCNFQYTITTYYGQDSHFVVEQIVEIITTFEVDEERSLTSSDGAAPWWCLKIRRGVIVFNDSEGQFAADRNKRDTGDSPHDNEDSSPLPSEINFFGLVNAALIVRHPTQNYTLVIDFGGNAGVGTAWSKNSSDCISSQTFSFSCIKAVESAFVFATFSQTDTFADFTDIASESFLISETYKELQSPTINYFQLITNNIETDALFSIYGKALSVLKIKNLDFGSNQIFNLTDKILTKMPSLEYLNLESSELKNIAPATFQSTPGLEILLMSHNQLTRVPELSTLQELRVLELSSQAVPRFSLSPHQQLNSLRVLNVSRNSIVDLDRQTFSGWTQLQVLDLSYCQLRHLEAGTFEGLQSLIYLNLEKNLLTTLHPHIFHDLHPSSQIYLRNNQMTGNLNLELRNVSLLDLSYNLIKTPENLISRGFVENLNLRFNSIIKWTSARTFTSEFHEIQNVNLSHNKIQAMKMDAILSTYSLQSIDLGGNLLDCSDCSLIEFQNWLNSSSSEILNLNASEPLRCHLPLEQSNVRVLDAQYNETLCLIKPFNYGLVSGVTVGVIAVLVLCAGVAAYRYRHELMYLKHLVRVRRRNALQVERSDCRFDVFVSYCGKDRDWVLNVLLPRLENPRDMYTCCLHERDFPLGSFIVDNIVSHISDSRRVVLVLTRDYVRSEWCQWEVQMAQHRIFADNAHFLVLIELERLPVSLLPLHLRVLMETRTYLEWREEVVTAQHFWRRLKLALGPAMTSSTTPEVEDEIDLSVPEFLLREQEMSEPSRIV